MEQKNKYPFFVDSKDLTDYEKRMRHFLMYDFNLCLKTILLMENAQEFDKWYFNCCRQTAIAGKYILELYFPDYSYKSYEAKMDDKIFGFPVTYEHCFIIATNKKDSNRQILIDMARTTNPLVFEPISVNHFYPDIENYKDLKIISSFEIPYDEILESNVTEYMTGRTTMDFLETLDNYIKMYQKNKTLANESKALNVVYGLPFAKMEHFKAENNLLGFR